MSDTEILTSGGTLLEISLMKTKNKGHKVRPLGVIASIVTPSHERSLSFIFQFLQTFNRFQHIITHYYSSEFIK